MSASSSGATDTLGWMERLRSKAAAQQQSQSQKSLTDISKLVRGTLLERRTLLDHEDKAVLRKALDKVAEAVPVRGTASMADRLEAIARNQSASGGATTGGSTKMKFHTDPHSYGSYCLSTEMFYVEIMVEGNRALDAKIHHIDNHNSAATSGQPTVQNCPEMVECLNKADFATFVKHLEGLMSIYALKKTDVAEKSRCWNTLSIVESDMELMYHSYNHSSGAGVANTDPYQMIHCSPLGLVKPRVGGLPMRITFFMTPSEMLMLQQQINSRQAAGESFAQLLDSGDSSFGLSVTVALEACHTPNMLPATSLINRANMGRIPLGPTNSIQLCARFLLVLNKPMVIETSKCKELTRLTDGWMPKQAGQGGPLMQNVVKTSTDGQLDPAGGSRGLFVTLKDQQHCYFMTDCPELTGAPISAIPFSHPAQVPEILAILRQQAMFNALIESCARPKAVQDLEKSCIFELSTVDVESLTVTFEIPPGQVATTAVPMTSPGGTSLESGNMASIELDLSGPPDVRAALYGGDGKLPTNVNGQSVGMAIQKSVMKGCQQQQVHSSEGQQQPQSQHLSLSAFSSVTKSDYSPLMLDGFKSEIKSEPMEYRETATSNNINKESLNDFGPQEISFLPGARQTKSLDNKGQSGAAGVALKILAQSGTEQATAQFSKGALPIKKEVDDSLVTAGERIHGKRPSTLSPNKSNSSSSSKSSKSAMPSTLPPSQMSPVKPNVSITPMSSRTTPATSANTGSSGSSNGDGKTKRSGGAGIEIIPLSRAEAAAAAESGKTTTASLKEFRPDSDSKRKSGSSSSSSSSSYSKKRKHEGDSRSSGSSSSGTSKSSSSSSGRTGGGSSSIPPSLSISRASSGGPPPPPSGGSAASVEIVPKSMSHSRDKSPSSSKSKEGGSLKVTLKSSSSSSSSSSKHRSSDHYKGSGSSNSSSSKGSSSSSSKSSSSHKSSSSPSSSSKGVQGEDAKWMFAGKTGFNSTFQIPKKSGEQTPPYRSSSDASKSMTSISPKMSQIGSSNSSSSPSRGANPPSASPKHHHSHHSSSYHHHTIPKSGNGSNRSDH